MEMKWDGDETGWRWDGNQTRWRWDRMEMKPDGMKWDGDKVGWRWDRTKNKKNKGKIKSWKSTQSLQTGIKIQKAKAFWSWERNDKASDLPDREEKSRRMMEQLRRAAAFIQTPRCPGAEPRRARESPPPMSPNHSPKVTKLCSLAVCETSLNLCPAASAHSSSQLPFISDPDGAAPSHPAGIKSHLLSTSFISFPFISFINDFNRSQNLLPCAGLGLRALDLGSHHFSPILQWNAWTGGRTLPIFNFFFFLHLQPQTSSRCGFAKFPSVQKT